MIKYLEVKDLQQDKPYKYVRMEDDSFRFTDINNNHSDIVDKTTEKAKSAGMFGNNEDSLRMLVLGSMTLRLNTLADDEDLLSKLIGKPFRNYFS